MDDMWACPECHSINVRGARRATAARRSGLPRRRPTRSPPPRSRSRPRLRPSRHLPVRRARGHRPSPPGASSRLRPSHRRPRHRRPPIRRRPIRRRPTAARPPAARPSRRPRTRHRPARSQVGSRSRRCRPSARPPRRQSRPGVSIRATARGGARPRRDGCLAGRARGPAVAAVARARGRSDATGGRDHDGAARTGAAVR